MPGMKTTKLVVLDYSTCTIQHFRIIEGKEINEELLISLGLNPENCHWMTSTDVIPVIRTRNIIK